MATALSYSPALSPTGQARSAKELERAHETERIIGILHQWGIHTLGQFAALAPDDLAARLGAEAVKLWQRANGQTERILKLVAPPEVFVESFEFEHEIETVEPLLFMLRRFLQQLGVRLNAIYLVAQQLRFRLTFADKSCYERFFKIPQPTNNEEVLFRMLYTHLENFTAKHPIVAVALEAIPSRAVRQQFGLFETTLRDPSQLYDTLARLVGLLGAEGVGTPVLTETHRPDAFTLEPFAWELPPAAQVSRSNKKLSQRRANSAEKQEAAPLPLRRFRQRMPATVLFDEGKPAHLRAAAAEGMTVNTNGPFPLSGNWWDETAWSRIEWDLEIEDGTIARCRADEQGWTLDGIYD